MRVLLYPWFGSHSKHYNKYSEMYKNLFGKTSVSVDIVPYEIKDGVTHKGWNDLRSGALSHHIKSDSYDCIHMISGGSLVAYNHLNYCKRNIKTDKIIFDSGPFWPCSFQASNYLCNYSNLPKRIFYNPFSSGIRMYWEKYENMDYTSNLNNYTKWLESNTDSLCIINRNDSLLFTDKINRYVKNSISRLVHIDAPHANLISSERYKETIKEYINEI